jgi:hypothetical protein
MNVPKRSALKRILEKDDVPSRHLILYVHNIKDGKNINPKFRLYCIIIGWMVSNKSKT